MYILIHNILYILHTYIQIYIYVYKYIYVPLYMYDIIYVTYMWRRLGTLPCERLGRHMHPYCTTSASIQTHLSLPGSRPIRREPPACKANLWEFSSLKTPVPANTWQKQNRQQASYICVYITTHVYVIHICVYVYICPVYTRIYLSCRPLVGH